MSLSPTSPSVLQVPLARTPFNVPSKPNGYYVDILISPNAGLDHAPHTCLVDTGSCGIVVPQAVLYENGDVTGTLLPGVTQGAAITIPYQPSKDDLVGFQYQVESLRLGDSILCENVQIVGVTNSSAKEGMMGVGFGRPLQFGTNVFLTAPSPNPSFLLTSTGISLGYTSDTLPSASAFAFQSLQPDGQNWQTPAAVITVGSTSFQGTALLDTGVNLMMFGLADPGWQQTFVNQDVTIGWPGGAANAGPILSYSFTVTGTELVQLSPTSSNKTLVYTISGSSPALPKYIVPMAQNNPSVPSTNFVNTGINVIQQASYFFDAKAGVIGFGPASP